MFVVWQTLKKYEKPAKPINIYWWVKNPSQWQSNFLNVGSIILFIYIVIMFKPKKISQAGRPPISQEQDKSSDIEQQPPFSDRK